MTMKKTNSKQTNKKGFSTSPKNSTGIIGNKGSQLAKIAEGDLGLTVMDSIQTESITDSLDDANRTQLVHKLPAMNERMDGEFFEAVF
jgi:hypothetical protein